MELAGYRGAFWPTPAEERLLEATLFRDERGSTAWEAIATDLGIDDMEPESVHLLPLLYRTLSARAIEHPLMARLKGIHRYAWYRNRMLFAASAPAIRALEADGVETMLLKGGAIAALWAGDVGARPMADIDLLVRPAAALRAMEVLERLGWKQRKALVSRASLVRVKHSAGFDSPDGHQVDLHWQVVANLSRYGPSHRSDPWARAIAVELQGTPTRAPDPADLLVHVVVHGARYRSGARLRWIGDGYTVLGAAPDLDWARALQTTTDLGLIPVMREALRYLADRFAMPVPTDVLRALERAPTTGRQERAFLLLAGPRPARRMGGVLGRYGRYSSGWPARERLAIFPDYLRCAWGVQRAWPLTRIAALRAIRAARRGIVGNVRPASKRPRGARKRSGRRPTGAPPAR